MAKLNMVQISAVDIRRAAMDLLARREHGYNELIRKLLNRFSKLNTFASKATRAATDLASLEVEPDLDLREMIEQQVAILQDSGLQSDDRLAETFIRARANRGQGPVKIKAELRGKGLTDSTIGFAFDNCGIDWFELVESVSHKRFGDSGVTNKSADKSTDMKMKARRSRFLQQRGFSFDHIRAIE
ncbi:MAG: regulatory protein RecX [bacterium]|nr:regulatory protein RecX [Gammaproteobacteria bacterium]